MEVQANNKKKAKEYWLRLSHVPTNQMYLSHKVNIL